MDLNHRKIYSNTVEEKGEYILIGDSLLLKKQDFIYAHAGCSWKKGCYVFVHHHLGDREIGQSISLATQEDTKILMSNIFSLLEKD